MQRDDERVEPRRDNVSSAVSTGEAIIIIVDERIASLAGNTTATRTAVLVPDVKDSDATVSVLEGADVAAVMSRNPLAEALELVE